MVEKCKNHRRSHHAASCGDDRKDGFAHRRELAVDDLALDFEPDGEEEDDHQTVVDELLDGHPLRERPVDQSARRMDHQREVGLQQVVVIVLDYGEVGQQHGHEDAGQQHDAASPGGFRETPAAQRQLVAVAHPAIH